MSKLIQHPEITLNFKLAPKTDAPVYLDTQTEILDIELIGPFCRNKKQQLICIQDKQAMISDDNGKTWQGHRIFAANARFNIDNSHSLLCTKDGTLVISFINTADYHFNWIKKRNKPTLNSRLYHYVVASYDDGKTWDEPVLLDKGYAAAATTLIELESGAILASSQNLDYQNGRHYSLSYRSEDNGKTWQASNHLDIGGQGHHDGCYEGTLIELEDCIWFCIRTNLDYFWHAYSYDDGKSWTKIQPGIEASSSPAMLKRLQSGRILMVFNTLYPLGQTEFKRIDGQFSKTSASWHREELVAMVSNDNAKSWSKPVILAQCKKAWLAYPYLFEASPGEIWLTTMQSELKIKFNESDFWPI